jgi:hypothetical protein
MCVGAESESELSDNLTALGRKQGVGEGKEREDGTCTTHTHSRNWAQYAGKWITGQTEKERREIHTSVTSFNKRRYNIEYC